MSEEMLIQYCSPTLAGLKTGSMFSVEFSSKEDMVCEFRRINTVLVKKGLRAIPIKKKTGKYLFYVYRPESLQRDLLNPKVKLWIS